MPTTTSSGFELNLDGIVTDLNRLAGEIDDISAEKTDGKVKYLGTITPTAGNGPNPDRWEISNVTIGKPIFILANADNATSSNIGSNATICVLQGAAGGNASRSDIFFLGRSEHSYHLSGSNCFVCIPTDTTVVLGVAWDTTSGSAPCPLLAYQ